MVTFSDKVYAAFELARELDEMLWMSGTGATFPYLSVDQFRDLVADRTAVAIRLRTIDVETKAVYGFIERWEEAGNKACIYIVKNIPPRWKRFVGVKELCHLVLDNKDDWSPDGADTLQRLTFTVGITDIDALENRAFRSENVAEMAAIELLYPHEDRRQHVADILAKKTDVPTIAAKYRLPEVIIQMVLTPAYLSMCDKYWKAVYEDHQARAARRLGVVAGGKD